MAEPRVWVLPEEPGPEVTALRDCHGREWNRDGLGWICVDIPWSLQSIHSWKSLFCSYLPLADATAELPEGDET